MAERERIERKLSEVRRKRGKPGVGWYKGFYHLRALQGRCLSIRWWSWGTVVCGLSGILRIFVDYERFKRNFLSLTWQESMCPGLRRRRWRNCGWGWSVLGRRGLWYKLCKKVSLNCILSDTFYLNLYKKFQFSLMSLIIASILMDVNCVKMSFFSVVFKEFLNFRSKY